MRTIFFKQTVFLLLVLVCAGFVLAEAADLYAGRAHYYELDTEFISLNWVGLKIINDANPLTDGVSPFMTLSLPTPLTLEVPFPGANLKDDQHYYAAMFANTFDASNIINVTDADLLADGLFDSTDYPQFYQQSYYSYSDNPQESLCCSKVPVKIGGVNYSAFEITLNQDINYYVLKYDDSGNTMPLFVVPLADETCYNSTSCVGEFMLPISPFDYNFYVLTETAAYDYNVWIDSVATDTFAQTALPYNVTVQVYNLYTGNVEPNVSVLIGEETGHNIFVPYSLSGFITRAYTIGYSDENGYETFLVAPTVYPSDSEYNIFVAAIVDGERVSRKLLYVTEQDALVLQDKTVGSDRLMDNARASINAMNQMSSYLYQWSSQLVQAKKFSVTYDLGLGSFTTYDHQISLISPNPITMKTGAPNVFTTLLVNYGSENPNDYSVRLSETGGYLVMSPYTDDFPLTETTRYSYQHVPFSQEFIVSPTSLGFISGNVSLEVLDENQTVIDSIPLNVTPELNIVTGGTFYNNDLLKTIVNALNQVLNSLYNAVN